MIKIIYYEKLFDFIIFFFVYNLCLSLGKLDVCYYKGRFFLVGRGFGGSYCFILGGLWVGCGWFYEYV